VGPLRVALIGLVIAGSVRARGDVLGLARARRWSGPGHRGRGDIDPRGRHRSHWGGAALARRGLCGPRWRASCSRRASSSQPPSFRPPRQRWVGWPRCPFAIPGFATRESW